MEEYKQHLLNWKDNCFDPSVLSEIEKLTFEEIKQSFSNNLSFGTGGLREKMGVGSNRINIYTIRQATQAIANFLKINNIENSKIVIGYDTRNRSREFAIETASVFIANGFDIFLFDEFVPTPLVSFAVRHYQASLGVMITASHNTKEYNGYKVYGSDGNQITLDMANSIAQNIDLIDPFLDVKYIEQSEMFSSKKYHVISEDFDDIYLNKFKTLDVVKEKLNRKVKITYSPLHGTGLRLVKKSLNKYGFNDLDFVIEQCTPDGNFPTVNSPNPEEKLAMKLAIDIAISNQSDLVLATDPDCDRVGVAVKHKNEYVQLSGNQIGALLVDYVTTILPQDTRNTIVTTIVTSDFGKEIALNRNFYVFETLTGFKFIGEKINEFETSTKFNFKLGYEESYGYLSGTFVRDKDAVIGALLIASMCDFHKSNGITLVDRLNTLYVEYGEFFDDLLNFKIETLKIKKIIDEFRDFSELNKKITNLFYIEDYLKSKRIFVNKTEELDLPKSNVLKVYLKDKSWFAIRPSGTEPKMKIYICAKSKDQYMLIKDFIKKTIV